MNLRRLITGDTGKMAPVVQAIMNLPHPPNDVLYKLSSKLLFYISLFKVTTGCHSVSYFIKLGHISWLGDNFCFVPSNLGCAFCLPLPLFSPALCPPSCLAPAALLLLSDVPRSWTLQVSTMQLNFAGGPPCSPQLVPQLTSFLLSAPAWHQYPQNFPETPQGTSFLVLGNRMQM